MRDRFVAMVESTQDSICAAIEALDGGATFVEERWERPGGGGGRSRALQEGRVFEKAGVNVSAVFGTLTDAAAAAMRASHPKLGDERRFFATGVSLVLHPHNPMAPTVHANYRYFELGDGEAPGSWWFGGGADLTPSYLFDEDAAHFHRVHHDALARHGAEHYPRFKRWCDDYFHIQHRGERRGVGGIFFDDLAGDDREARFALVSDCAAAFLPAYMPIIKRRFELPYDEAHKRWQQLRRGRYVEFNLVWDRGTLFGLRTDARVESVLMSLPLTARWEVNAQPEPGSEEARLVAVLREPRDWL
jgi:coproporphyrinogen III oxidase